jgi:hypothetical protein
MEQELAAALLFVLIACFTNREGLTIDARSDINSFAVPNAAGADLGRPPSVA